MKRGVRNGAVSVVGRAADHKRVAEGSGGSSGAFQSQAEAGVRSQGACGGARELFSLCSLSATWCKQTGEMGISSVAPPGLN